MLNNMKKLYAFLFSIGLVSAVSAQVEIRDYTGTGGTQVGNDISGTTYTVNVTQTGLVVQHFAVTNVSGSNQYMRVKRLQLSAPGDWTNALCWGQDPDDYFEGGCYTTSQMTTNPWTSPNATGTNHAPMIDDQNHGDLKLEIDVQSAGTGLYRYYIMPNQGGAAIDSIDLQINMSVGIEEKEVLGMTAYPNPANNALTVNTTGTENVVLKITDVLGKVVYYDEVGAIKKLDVSDYKSGVYLVSVYNEGVLVQTRRVVIKH
jgi:hypothetical protein